MCAEPAASAGALLHQGVATIHEAMGRRGLAVGISLLVGPPFAGPAVTVSIPAGDNLGIHAALRDAPAGCVVCVASAGGGAFGVLGELILTAARERRISGLVIDDGIRDVGQLSAPPSVAARGVSARGTVKRRVQSIGGPIGVGGVLIRPGDWVLVDADGVCVVPDRALRATIASAEARTGKEDDIRAALLEGHTTVTVLGLEPLLDGPRGADT